MTYKQIESARQTRLMITEVVVPAALAIIAIDGRYPHLKYSIKNKCRDVKDNVKKKFHKTKKEVE